MVYDWSVANSNTTTGSRAMASDSLCFEATAIIIGIGWGCIASPSE